MATKFPGTFNPFQNGFRTIDGSKLNKLFSGLQALTGLALSGFMSQNPQILTATGATQAAATLITKSVAIITVSTASARGVRLPTASTGLMVNLFSQCTQGSKVYPGAGARISSAATNVAVVIAGFKGNLYVAENATTWVLNKGA